MWKKAAFGLLMVAVGVAWYIWQQQSQVVSVQTHGVERGDVESILQLTGKVINDRTVTITALLDGEIMSILAREGDPVKKGDVLAKLDSRQAQALVDKADAELVFQRQALDAAKRNYERTQRLSSAGNASKQAMDDSLDQRLSAEASVKAAEATLKLNNLRLDNAVVRSPFDGTVVSKTAETGQWLEAGTPLFTVVATEGTIIEAFANATDWSRISLAQRATLSSETLTDGTWESEVSWIAPSVSRNNASGNSVAVRFPLGADAPPLLLGQEIDVDLVLEQAKNTLMVPLDTLVEREDQRFVAFVVDGGVARERPVSLGITSLTHAQVVDGLSEAEQIIVPARHKLRDGQPVSVL